MLDYVPTANQKADGLTKPLSGPKHNLFLAQLGMKEMKTLSDGISDNLTGGKVARGVC